MIHPDLNFHIDFAVECLLKIKKGKCLKAGFAYGCVLNDFECFHLPVRYEQQRHSQTKLCVLVHSCTLWYECARQRQLYLPIQSVAFDQLTPLWMNTMTSQQNCFDNVSNCFRALTAIQPGRERGQTLAALRLAQRKRRLWLFIHHFKCTASSDSRFRWGPHL